MKKWILGFVTAGILFGGLPTFAEEVFRIEIGSKKSNWNQRETLERLYRLEMAVEQLQRKVFDLETRQQIPQAPEKKWSTCYINTPFDGTFSATEPTETAAKALALTKCNEKSSATFCKERDVKCGN